MLTRLRLERFKNFERAELALGPFTVLVGANAAGKSNVRDALRFLHGVGRSYTLAEIIGEKWGEGGVLQWRGIRGGTREVAFEGGDTFSLGASLTIDYSEGPMSVDYRIEVDVGASRKPPRVIAERLTAPSLGSYLFDSHPSEYPVASDSSPFLRMRVRAPGRGRNPVEDFLAQQPVLSQIENHKVHIDAKGPAVMTRAAFTHIRFLDLVPDAMRLPSIPGQDVLGDRGENLSSVLLDICQDPDRKQALVHWLQELTPLDARDFEFPADQTGRVLVTLVEANGWKTSAYSASEGTLRFLAMIAALLSPMTGQTLVFEELENGIHPTRLHLLVQLIEQSTREGRVQVIVTTHSPQLLRLLSPDALELASLIYRLPGRRDARITRTLDIPEARRVLEEQDIGRLFASGWLEDAVAFQETAGAVG